MSQFDTDRYGSPPSPFVIIDRHCEGRCDVTRLHRLHPATGEATCTACNESVTLSHTEIVDYLKGW